MKKRLTGLLLSALCALLLSACSLELSDQEIEGRLNKIAAILPSTEVSAISLSKTMADEGQACSAAVQLTWNGKEGRFTTEKALDQYSRAFADEVTARIPVIADLSLSWVVPFHSADEASMIYVYQRRKDGLTQVGLSDRFTDGSFGADAFIDPNAMVEIPVRRVESEGAKTVGAEDGAPADGETAPPDGTAGQTPGENAAPGGGTAQPAEGAASQESGGDPVPTGTVSLGNRNPSSGSGQAPNRPSSSTPPSGSNASPGDSSASSSSPSSNGGAASPASPAPAAEEPSAGETEAPPPAESPSEGAEDETPAESAPAEEAEPEPPAASSEASEPSSGSDAARNPGGKPADAETGA